MRLGGRHASYLNLHVAQLIAEKLDYSAEHTTALGRAVDAHLCASSALRLHALRLQDIQS